MLLSKKCIYFDDSLDENQAPDPVSQYHAHSLSCTEPHEVQGKQQIVYFVDKLYKKPWHWTEWIVLSALTRFLQTVLKTQVVMGITLIIAALLDN